MPSLGLVITPLEELFSKYLESLGESLEMYIQPPPPLTSIVEDLAPRRALEIFRNVAQAPSPVDGYVHWDKLRHLSPPEGLTSEEWWLALKLSRNSLLKELPLKDLEGNAFAYSTPDEALRLLHYVDQRCGGDIAMPEVVTADEQARQHYLVNSLMEEAIRSSQLEGATTSRTMAKELIRSGRPPSDRSERMILNNYNALLFMRDMGDKLTPELILELQRILTEGTFENPEAAGRLQLPDEERVRVVDRQDGSALHIPPPAEELPKRLELLCAFANEESDVGSFMHPAVRAILLHFWLAYDHPFEDGNGRTARALFYWAMRRRSYWLVEYLSISKILREAPAKYTRSFLYTETDDRDTTYFILFQLDVIKRAVEELHTYLQRKVSEIREIESLMRGSADFNHRQLALVSDAVRNPSRAFTFLSHANSHHVTHETARHDLLQLERRGLLERRRVRKKYVFTPASNLSAALQELGQK